MRVDINKSGIALEIGRAVISLGWFIWGVDISPKRYCIIHLWRPALFWKWESE